MILEMKIVEDINETLNKYGLKISYSDLVISENNIMETIVKDKTCTFTGKPLKAANFSNKIIDSLFPFCNDVYVYHYTSKEVAESIINNKKFRLYNIKKRIKENEITSFCLAHGIIDSSVSIPNTYFSSFTGTDLTTEKDTYLWENFATHDGVRIKFRIKTTKPNRTDILRKIYYEKTKKSKPIPILGDLEKVANKYNKRFTLKGVSTICSYYLPRKYNIEDEYRILHRNIDGREIPVKKDNKGFEYIEISLEEENNTGYFLKIEEVTYTSSIDIKSKENYQVIKRA